MAEHKANPVDSFENLRDRVERFVLGSARLRHSRAQLSLALPPLPNRGIDVITPRGSVAEFLGFMSDALPKGDIYLFGGVLRDLALLGRRGFNSDIDLVVEGDWNHCIPYLQSLEARRNKFGGYRLNIGGWPIDIWNARETWAIAQGLVAYSGIASLTQTTVLNWDAILMNWRTRTFIYRDGYLSELRSRLLDIVLEQNPNPLGMAVRVFRHLSVKDARQVTSSAAMYLANCTAQYSFEAIHNKEMRSYGNAAIELPIYRFFERIKENENLEMHARFETAIESLKKEGIAVPNRQSEWNFENIVDNR
jgi:hypothetical protein